MTGGGRLLRSLLVVLLIWGVVGGCGERPHPPAPPVEQPQRPIPRLINIPASLLRHYLFEDDGDAASFLLAAQRSLSYLQRVPATKQWRLGDLEFSAELYARRLAQLIAVVERQRLTTEDLLTLFDVYVYETSRGSGRVLATGYYEPILEGSTAPSRVYSYPLYSLPRDLVRVSLEDFHVSCKELSSLVGRVDGQKLVPYYSRKEIDEGALRGMEPLVWVKSPVEAFFLHIQGSGIIRFPDGSERRLGYGGANGRAYKS